MVDALEVDTDVLQAAATRLRALVSAAGNGPMPDGGLTTLPMDRGAVAALERVLVNDAALSEHDDRALLHAAARLEAVVTDVMAADHLGIAS